MAKVMHMLTVNILEMVKDIANIVFAIVISSITFHLLTLKIKIVSVLVQQYL